MNPKRMLIIIAAVIGLCCQSAYSQGFSGLVAFGDSLSDLGNTAATLSDTVTGYNSYYYDQGRWSNGPVWVEDLARQMFFNALQRNDGTNLYGTDFAWGGSTSETGYTYVYLANLQEQVKLYIALLTTKYAQMPDIKTTLFTVWSGGNDVIYYVDGYTTRYTPQKLCDNIAAAVTTLYNAGGRYFIVPNLPPLGDKPNYRGTKDEAKANDFVNTYNPLLQNRLALLRTQLTGITIIAFDAYRVFKAVLMNPEAYKLTNVTDAAFTPNKDRSQHYGSVVKNPDQYLFWDQTHPTRTGHAIIAQVLDDVVAATFGQQLGLRNEPSSPLLLAGSQ
jgi:phospholipase/lecithinase/hemolysin